MHVSDDCTSFNLVHNLFWRTYIYLNRILLEMVCLGCNFGSFFVLQCFTSQWEIYLNKVLVISLLIACNHVWCYGLQSIPVEVGIFLNNGLLGSFYFQGDLEPCWRMQLSFRCDQYNWTESYFKLYICYSLSRNVID